jgi:hypothetical protein
MQYSQYTHTIRGFSILEYNNIIQVGRRIYESTYYYIGRNTVFGMVAVSIYFSLFFSFSYFTIHIKDLQSYARNINTETPEPDGIYRSSRSHL